MDLDNHPDENGRYAMTDDEFQVLVIEFVDGLDSYSELSHSKKGVLITIGDDCCHNVLTRSEIRRVFGDNADYDLSSEELIAAAEEKYHVFHICIDRGAPEDVRIFADWRSLMKGRAASVNKRDISCLSELIYALISVAEGRTPNEALASVDQRAAEIAARSLAYISISDNNNILL